MLHITNGQSAGQGIQQTGIAGEVLSGGIDRWLGGVHLQGRNAAWRWDRWGNTLVENRA